MQLLFNESNGVLAVNDADFALSSGMVAGLNFCVGMGSWLDMIQQLRSDLSVRTEGIEPREDIYSSLFTMSRYKELDAEQTAAVLANDLIQKLFSAAGEDVTAILAGLDASRATELTYFEANNAYLMKLDMRSNGEDILVTVAYDVVSVNAAVYIDSDVTDWDETYVAIRDGERGRGVSAFLLTDVYGDEVETYVEISPIGLKAGKTWELTLTESGTDKELDILVRVDGKKYIEVEGECVSAGAEIPEGSSFDDAVSLLGDDLGHAVTVMMEAVGADR